MKTSAIITRVKSEIKSITENSSYSYDSSRYESPHGDNDPENGCLSYQQIIVETKSGEVFALQPDSSLNLELNSESGAVEVVENMIKHLLTQDEASFLESEDVNILSDEFDTLEYIAEAFINTALNEWNESKQES